MQTMSRPQQAQVADRLKLPAPEDWTINEAHEASTCTGCRVVYQGKIRFIHARHGCPAHTRG